MMRIHISHKGWMSIGLTLGLLALVWLVSTALAQEVDPSGQVIEIESGDKAAAAPMGGPDETHGFSYQGYLEYDGQPANGYFDFAVNLYTAETGGYYVASCDNVNSPSSLDNQLVTDGLFTFHLLCGGWNSDVFTGDSRWLGVWVRPAGGGLYTELPRQPISPAPYAWSVKTGAVVDGGVASPSAAISVTQTTGGGWDGPFAVYGYSAGKTGVYGRGYAYGVGGFGNYAGLQGVGGLIGLDGDGNYYGVTGYARLSSGKTYGLYGWSASSTEGIGVFGYGKGGVGGKFMSYVGNLIEGWEDVSGDGYSNLQRRFRVTYTGEVYADGGYHCGKSTSCWYTSDPADFAEVLPAAIDPEPADVLVVGADGQLARSSAPYQTSVVGVYSTNPMYVGGGDNLGQAGYVPLAVVGVVPVKASAENGPIVPGDLLTTSATPGHAMRAGAAPPVGTIIGKALEPLDAGTGVIAMLVTLQ